MEEWKWINGFEGIYEISSSGRIKSYKIHKDGYILSNTNKKGGYFSIVLSSKELKMHTRVHVLVANAFIGPKPIGHHVHHIDGNKQNNNVSNLMYILPSDHCMETISANPNVLKNMINYNKFIRPKRIYMYGLDGLLLKTYSNAKEASDDSGVCKRNILQVASRDEYKPGLTRKQAGGYVWKFE